MKFSTALVLSLTASTASAFAPAARPALSTRFASTTEGVEATPAAPVAAAAPAAPGATAVVDGAVVTAGAAIEEGHGVDLPIMEEASTGRIQPYVILFLADFCFVLFCFGECYLYLVYFSRWCCLCFQNIVYCLYSSWSTTI